MYETFRSIWEFLTIGSKAMVWRNEAIRARRFCQTQAWRHGTKKVLLSNAKKPPQIPETALEK